MEPGDGSSDAYCVQPLFYGRKHDRLSCSARTGEILKMEIQHGLMFSAGIPDCSTRNLIGPLLPKQR